MFVSEKKDKEKFDSVTEDSMVSSKFIKDAIKDNNTLYYVSDEFDPYDDARSRNRLQNNFKIFTNIDLCFNFMACDSEKLEISKAKQTAAIDAAADCDFD